MLDTERLRAVLGPALSLGPTDVTIVNLRKVTGNSARTTWAFDAVTPHDRRALILHAGQTGRGFAQQAEAVTAAAACGVPVARIVAADDSPAALGTAFLISEAAQGDTDYFRIVDRLDGADPHGGRTRLLQQCAFALAAVHRVAASTPESARWFRLSICRSRLDALGHPVATFEWAVRWLIAHEPPAAPAVLVHGDYRMGNLVVDGSDLAAVLDWEWVHVGEPAEDLAWFCLRAWRFGAPASLGAGGLGSIETFLSAYEQASGTVVDRTAFHWWQVMTTLFWGVMCLDRARSQSPDDVPALQKMRANRQACESEWDLLDLLNLTAGGHDGRHEGGGQAPSGVFDRTLQARAWRSLLE